MTEHALTLRGLYEEHFQFVWKSLRRLGVREADVPDAVQDVFIVVHRKLPEFEGRSKVTTWLFGIALRVARDRQKLAYTRRQVDDESAVSSCVDVTADVAADLERKQGLELLEAILDTMPIEQRAVFTLFELEGCTGEAIAELLELPLGTVYSRLRLAREVFQRSVQRLQAREGKRPPPPPPRSSGIHAVRRESESNIPRPPQEKAREAHHPNGPLGRGIRDIRATAESVDPNPRRLATGGAA